jgi:hypothetical protein
MPSKLYLPSLRMLDILTIFMKVVSDQPHLHENYLCLIPQLPPDYFVGALLLEDLVAVLITPLFGLIWAILKCHVICTLVL